LYKPAKWFFHISAILSSPEIYTMLVV